jgi:hypothetical protein
MIFKPASSAEDEVERPTPAPPKLQSQAIIEHTKKMYSISDGPLCKWKLVTFAFVCEKSLGSNPLEK